MTISEVYNTDQYLSSTLIDSWKGYSPLESIARLSSLSVLHKHIAQLLLLSGAHHTLEEGEEIDNAEAQATVNRYLRSSRLD